MVLQALSTLLTIAVLFLGLLLPISCLDFIYNTFNSSSLLLYGNATIQSSVLTLTESGYSIGRAFYQHPIPTRLPNSSHILPFSTSFIFSISHSNNQLVGNWGGFAFLFAPFSGINGTNYVGYFGLRSSSDFNFSSHVFAITFGDFVGVVVNC